MSMASAAPVDVAGYAATDRAVMRLKVYENGNTGPKGRGFLTMIPVRESWATVRAKLVALMKAPPGLDTSKARGKCWWCSEDGIDLIGDDRLRVHSRPREERKPRMLSCREGEHRVVRLCLARLLCAAELSVTEICVVAQDCTDTLVLLPPPPPPPSRTQSSCIPTVLKSLPPHSCRTTTKSSSRSTDCRTVQQYRARTARLVQGARPQCTSHVLTWNWQVSRSRLTWTVPRSSPFLSPPPLFPSPSLSPTFSFRLFHSPPVQ